MRLGTLKKRCLSSVDVFHYIWNGESPVEDISRYCGSQFENRNSGLILMQVRILSASTFKRRYKMSIQEFITKVRKEFDLMIAQKTGWGKDEVMRTFDLAILRVSFNELSKELENDK